MLLVALLGVAVIVGCGSARGGGAARAAQSYPTCLGHSPSCPVTARDRARYLNIAGAGAEPELPYVVGSTFWVAAGTRRFQLVGYKPVGATPRPFCSVVLPSPDGRYLMYGVSRYEWPALEVLDLFTGARFLFRDRACDPAWGSRDQIAYVHYLSVTPGSGGYGPVWVQHGLSGIPRAWTRAGTWYNLIWAGNQLLAQSYDGFSGQCSLAIVDGPSRQRAVESRSSGVNAPCSTVVAVNPEGTEALLDTQRQGLYDGSQGSEDFAALLRLSDDTVLSTALIDTNEQGDLNALGPDGDWRGNEVITTEGISSGGSTHPPALLVTLTVAGAQVRLRSVKPFIDHGRSPMGQNLAFAKQARFLGSRGERVAVWFGGLGHLQYLACNTTTEQCAASRNYRDPSAGSSAGFVTNPSRPLSPTS